MEIEIDFTDLIRLKTDVDRLGKLPQKCVTKAVRAGAKVVLREEKRLAPYRFGYLEKGIILAPEKTRKPGKKVIETVFDRRMNDIFRKTVKNPGKGKKNTAYYPSSMEYGFDLKNGKGHREGERFMQIAAKNKESEMNDIVIRTLTKELDKEWAKR